MNLLIHDNLSAVEGFAFQDLQPFILHHNGIVPEYDAHLCKKSLIHFLLSVDNTAYFYSDHSLTQSIRKLLKRFCEVKNLLENNNVANASVSNDFTSTDIFNQVEIQSGFYASVLRNNEEVKITDVCGPTLSLWLYHFLINGNSHPTTRETITKFHVFGNPYEPCLHEENNIKAIHNFLFGSTENILNNGLPSKLFFINTENLSLSLQQAPNDEIVPSINLMMLYESAYAIPDDRKFSKIILNGQRPPPILSFYPVHIHSFSNNNINYIHDDQNMSNDLSNNQADQADQVPNQVQEEIQSDQANQIHEIPSNEHNEQHQVWNLHNIQEFDNFIQEVFGLLEQELN